MSDKDQALRLADALDNGWCPQESPREMMEAADELRRLAAVEAERDALRAERDALLSLIADDAFAASFQSLAQYRSALLKTKGGVNG